MYCSQIKKNQIEAFKHLVERQKQDKNTIVVNGKEFSYTTKRKKVKRFIGFDSFNDYRRSELYPRQAERVNGFVFVPVQ